MKHRAAQTRIRALVVMSLLAAPSPAAAKTLIDYFQPTPIFNTLKFPPVIMNSKG